MTISVRWGQLTITSPSSYCSSVPQAWVLISHLHRLTPGEELGVIGPGNVKPIPTQKCLELLNTLVLKRNLTPISFEAMCCLCGRESPASPASQVGDLQESEGGGAGAGEAARGSCPVLRATEATEVWEQDLLSQK